jgi:hypothetical protein
LYVVPSGLKKKNGGLRAHPACSGRFVTIFYRAWIRIFI